MHSSIFTALFLFIATFTSVSAHGVLTSVAGSNGVTGQGFGVDPSTPRDGSSPRPFEQDTSIIRNAEIKTGKTDVCGRTKLGGNNEVSTQLAAAAQAGLPAMDADGTVHLVIHQVNQDGAGPYTCEMSATGTGSDFVKMDVTQNVPGFASLSRAKATDFDVTAVAPSGMTCTGGPNGDACLVRCRNAALAGPFGGCAAVTNYGAGALNSTAAAGNVTAAATQKRAVTSRIIPRTHSYWI